MSRFLFISSLLLLFAFFSNFNLTNASNILAVNAVLSHSHHLWHEKLLIKLAENGHNVTFLSFDESHHRSKENYTVIKFEGVYEKAKQSYNLEDFVNYGPLDVISVLWDYSHFTCDAALHTKGLKSLLNYPKEFKFDLIVLNVQSGQCLYPLIKRFGNPPVVATSSFGNQHVIADIFGQHIHSYVPYFMSKVGQKMTFWQRFKNLFYVASFNIARPLYFLSREYNSAVEVFGKDLVEDFVEIERKMSVLLVNSDNFVNYPQPYAPNVIPVGGLHIPDLNVNPNTEHGLIQKQEENYNEREEEVELEKYKGVIAVSLCSNLQLNLINDEILTSFSNIMEEELNYKVVINGHFDIKKSKHMKATGAILSHKKTKVLLTHGSTMNIQDAIFYGVPIVGIPIFLDQHVNMASVEDKKIGINIDIEDFNAESLKEAIMEVIDNPLYGENAKALSKKYRDQPHKPLELAVYWVEYILRHKSASHLDIALRDMNFFQSANLDILLTLILIIFSILFVSYAVISRILKKTRPVLPVNGNASNNENSVKTPGSPVSPGGIAGSSSPRILQPTITLQTPKPKMQ